MVRGSASLGAQIGRLATPQAELLGGPFEKKVQDFFREVCMQVSCTSDAVSQANPHMLKSKR